ncbi:hypothetical protein IAU59_006295 [Kwoniella sp. CBS 9459]
MSQNFSSSPRPSPTSASPRTITTPSASASASAAPSRPLITPEAEVRWEAEGEEELSAAGSDGHRADDWASDDEYNREAEAEGEVAGNSNSLPRTAALNSDSGNRHRTHSRKRLASGPGPGRRRKSRDDQDQDPESVFDERNDDGGGGDDDSQHPLQRISKRPRLSAESDLRGGFSTSQRQGGRESSSQSSQPSPPTTPPSPSTVLNRQAILPSSPSPASNNRGHTSASESSSRRSTNTNQNNHNTNEVSGRDSHLERGTSTPLPPPKPRIKPGGIFWRSNTRPPLADTTPKTNLGPGHMSDVHLGLRPLTVHMPDDEVVKTLGLSPSLIGSVNEGKQFTLTRADLLRYRTGLDNLNNFTISDQQELSVGQRGAGGRQQKKWDEAMCIARACWRKWEEMGGLPKGMGDLLGFAYDPMGNPYKPEITHVQAIRLVIAASPKRMMTLAQIYQAIEERWPWHTTAGPTWKNSIRHNLSLNDCFVNTERPTHEGSSGKGGYWIVNDELSGKTARKVKRPGQLPPAGMTTFGTATPAADTATQSRSSSYLYPSPTKSSSGDYFASRQQQEQRRSNPASGAGSASAATSVVGSRSRVVTPPSATGSTAGGILVFTPPSAQASHRMSAAAQASKNDTSSTSAQTYADKGGKGKTTTKIAKPATPYPYAIPQKPPNWVPDEVIQSSREIGLSRPAHDTPLDKPVRAQKPKASSTDTRAVSPSQTAAGLRLTGPGQASGPGPSTIQSSSELRDLLHLTSPSLVPTPTTRGGIPPLPTVEPGLPPNAGPGPLMNASDRLQREGLPSLMRAIYQPDIAKDDVELPPVIDD